MPLLKEVQTLLDMVYRVGAPAFHQMSVEQARHSFRKLQFAFNPDRPPVASVLDIPVPRKDGSAMLTRLYRPLQRNPGEVLPLLIFFHGGGWCIGDIESYDTFCRDLTNRSNCAVLSVEYRLAPEHPFPAATDDAMLAYEWAMDNEQLLGIDSERIGLAGDSAGGNLAIVTAIAARDKGARVPVCLLLIYPCTLIRSESDSRRRFEHGFMLDTESLEWFFERYLRGHNEEDWRASPMRAQSLRDLPSMCLVTAEYDPLLDDCEAFSERVRAQGGKVERIQVPGVVHGFITLGKLIPVAEEVVNHAARWAGAQLAQD